MKKLLLLISICALTIGCRPSKKTSTTTEAEVVTSSQPNQLESKVLKRINDASSLNDLLASLKTAPADLSGLNLKIIKKAIWEKYKTEAMKNPFRLREHLNKAIEFNGKTMKYAYEKVGEKPKNGYALYIALHGGGGAPTSVNDSQWEAMKRYYLGSVREGVYVAPRGMTDTWNLHSVAESYPAYDRLIENMILFENVDPNRVYFLGYSAGGDGTYQVVPRMTDRFAAANMSAGHPNGVNMMNVYHVPFLLQVGELDEAYKRNTVTVEYAEKLKKLQEKAKGGYKHDIYVHWEQGHSYVKDHSGANSMSEIIANPSEWRQNSVTKQKTTTNTDAITWMSKHTRNPIPNHLIWDYITRESSRSGAMEEDFFQTPNRPNLFYWIECHDNNQAVPEPIEVTYSSTDNIVQVEEMGSNLTIWLNEEMIDFSKPIKVNVSGEFPASKFLPIKPSLSRMIESLQDRGDFHYIFSACVTVKRVGGYRILIEEGRE